MKSLANYISVSRVILAIFMGLMEPLSFMFYMFYFLCGISDILDGYIARKTNTTSEMGDKLDSIADFVIT